MNKWPLFVTAHINAYVLDESSFVAINVAVVTASIKTGPSLIVNEANADVVAFVFLDDKSNFLFSLINYYWNS